MKSISFLVIGFILGTIVSVAISATYEAGNNDAVPVVGYGKYNGAIVAIKVAADGTLQ